MAAETEANTGTQLTAEANVFDRLMNAGLGRMTRGLSPPAIALANLDWALHLSMHPGKQAELVEKAYRKALRLGVYASRCVSQEDTEPCIEPLPQDHRFDAEEWRQWPFNIVYQSFLLGQQWWHNATTGVRGVNRHHEDVVNFLGRQVLDLFSPSNYLWTNPEILRRTMEEGGQNLLRGWQNFIEDVEREVGDRPPAGVDDFVVGRDMAATPGKVVFRNELMELIQYEPQTKTVFPEPVLIVPAWIMKYYILDLKPGASLIEYLVEQGHTVFAVSWKNPDADDLHFGMEDYRRLGVMDALDTIGKIVPDQKVHGVGYCLGGTLMSLAAAAMARDGDDRLATLSLFAAQHDFTEPGELELFIDDSQVAFLEDVMWANGYLSRSQMAGAFAMLNSQDLVWSRMIHDYLLGERSPMFELMAWNADATRLPYRMHSEYLRHLFLNNDLAEGRYDVGGQPIHIGDIKAPIFAVGTERDHVAPWQSAYKINRFARTDVTFLLTSSGHNSGIVTPPGHPRRHYRMTSRRIDDRYVAPEQFLAEAPKTEGSWWPAWENWLRGHAGSRRAPPEMGAPEAGLAPLANAPGSYVMQR